MVRYSKVIEGLSSSVPFVGPEAQERNNNMKFLARLGANESNFGPSPKVLEAIKQSADDVWMYADPESHDLKASISAHLAIKSENIIVGEGIDGLLGYLCRLLVNPDVRVVTSKGAYPTFNYHVSGFGGHPIFVPYKNDYENVEGLLREAEKTTASLIYLANPDNPMGTFHSRATIERIVENLPENTLLCLDEAYSEFVPKDELPNIDPENPKVIRMRTFSKGYGLAGIRIGYAIGPADLIKSFDKIRNHFGINSLAQRAAIVALEDQEYLASVVKKVQISKEGIVELASECGLKTIPSYANFVAIDCGRDAKFAKTVLNGLIEEKIFVRMPFFEPQNRCIRISAGKPKDIELLRQKLPVILSSL
jgi:histidinol-phosphate aminotransferase